MSMNFKDYCENLYQNWKTNNDYFDEFSPAFETDYLPEPYYVIKDGNKRLYVLNNNPGKGLEEQLKSKFDKIPSYKEAAKRMAVYYQGKKNIGNAATRIQKMQEFAGDRGYDGVENVETFFLHSSSFNKKKFLKKYCNEGKGSKLVTEYLESLQSYLKDKPVLAVTAVGTRKSITKESLESNSWVQLMCKIIHLDFQNAHLKELSKKGDKVTSALLIDNENEKYMTLMMGSNNIPSIER